MKLKMQDSNLSAYLAVAVGVFCIGCSAIFVKIANVEGTVSSFYRLCIAALVILPLWALRRPALPKLKDLLWIGLCGLFFALDLVLFNSGLLLTSAAKASFLANSAPLWVGLGAFALFREKLQGRFWAGLLISLAGLAFIVGENAWRELRLNPGDLMALGAGFFYAAFLLAAQKARKRVDTLTFTALSTAAGVFILFPASFLSGHALIGFPAKTWLALLGLGLFSHLLGWLALNKALGRLRAAPMSVILLAQPVVTSVLAVLLLGESLQNFVLLGGMMVLSGIFLSNRKR